jgi:ABC-type bacteriocin/lantibiotic exporter with double-glycine peptidase domain
VDAIADRIPGIDYKMLELLYKDTRAKFTSMSLKNVGPRVELRKLKSVLRKSHIPILLTSTSLFGEKDGLPHGVVLTGYGKNSWYINNPLGKRPNTRLSHEVMEENLGYRQVRCALIVAGLRQQRRSVRRARSLDEMK